jgi:hypothetical protein
MLGRPSWAPYDLLAEIEPGTDDAVPLPQIIFETPGAGAHPVAALDWMRGRPDLLLQHLRQRGLEDAKPKFVVAWRDDGEWVVELARAVGGTPGSLQAQTGPPERIPLTATVRVTPVYFQAVAKIAFHYALKMFPDLTGREAEFTQIKDFILQGGNIDRFVIQRPDQWLVNLRRGDRPTHWMHVLAVERARGGLTAFAQFFAGPPVLPPGYEIRLGSDPSRIVRLPERRGHYFVITDPAAPEGPVGKMEDAQPAHLIWVVPW